MDEIKLANCKHCGSSAESRIEAADNESWASVSCSSIACFKRYKVYVEYQFMRHDFIGVIKAMYDLADQWNKLNETESKITSIVISNNTTIKIKCVNCGVEHIRDTNSTYSPHCMCGKELG